MSSSVPGPPAAARSRRVSAHSRLVMTAGLAALAMSAIFMASSSGLMTKYYDRERNTIATRPSRRSRSGQPAGQGHLDPSGGTGYIQLLTNGTLTDANGNKTRHTVKPLRRDEPAIRPASSVSSRARRRECNDTTGNTRYVRRLELMAQNFARYAMFTNQFSSGLCYVCR